MLADIFGAVDAYIEKLFIQPDPVLEQVVANTRAAGMPEIQVSPIQGKYLAMLVQLTGARRVLELGTLAGYSSIWMARALPADGRLVTLEYSPAHVALSKQHFELAGVAEKIEIMTGPALDNLPRLAGGAAFDFVFIDADKPNYCAYLDWAVRLSCPGALIVADNVVRSGRILDPASAPSADERANAEGVDAFNRKLAAHPGLESIITQQIGAKSHDGIALARVL
jgi:predicted O-methyltransferase YrrM